MNKPLQSFIIGLGIASIVLALYGVFKGGKFIEAIGGIVIGASLIGAIVINQNRNKKLK
jgi:hypothetical protein